MLIEKRDAYQTDYEIEEKERNKASTPPPQLVVDLLPRKKKAEAEKQREITKMIHIELMGEDGEETQLQMETFTSSKVTQKEKPTESCGKREDVMFSSTDAKSELSTVDKSDKTPCSPAETRSETMKTFNPDATSERAPRKVRREKRPQSLNLGMSRDFVYETEAKSSNITQDSVESDEDNNTESIEESAVCHPTTDTWSPSMTKKLNQPEDSGSPLEEKQMELQIHDQGAERIDEGQEKPSTEIKIMNTEDKQENQDSVNGPGKDELKKVKTDIRFEVMKVIMIDNNGNNEEPDNVDEERMEELGLERKISNIELDKTEMVQTAKESRKTSLRVTGHSRTDITRIVPLKPERAKSQGYKDDLDIGQDSEPMKRSFKRYSMNESFERQFDPSKFECRDFNASSSNASPVEAKISLKESSLAMTDHYILVSSEQKTYVGGSPQEGAVQDAYTSRVVHGDLLQPDEALSDVQTQLPRTPVHQKNAPPTPPVKTKKARESVLILRNSRNFSTDPVLEDKKSLPVNQLGIFCIFSHWTKTCRMRFRSSHASIFFFFILNILVIRLKSIISACL